MSATTKRKRKAKTQNPNEGRILAQSMFKRGTYTSQWTQQDADQYFSMYKNTVEVFRTGKNDTEPAKWIMMDKKLEKLIQS